VRERGRSRCATLRRSPQWCAGRGAVGRPIPAPARATAARAPPDRRRAPAAAACAPTPAARARLTPPALARARDRPRERRPARARRGGGAARRAPHAAARAAAATTSPPRPPLPPAGAENDPDTHPPRTPQPKEIKDIKQFLLAARRKDARSVRVKKARGGATKFKVRTARTLFTLVVADAEKAAKLKQSLPPGLQVLDNV